MATGTQSSTTKKSKASSPAKSKTASKSASSKSTAKKSSSTPKTDPATRLLMQDHRAVEKLFKQYEKAKENPAEKQAIFQQIYMELAVHTQIEEEIFYPASRPHIDEEDIVNEAEVEHASAKDLMAQLQKMKPEDPYYDAKVKVLQEMIEHHVEEEEKEYFPECRKSDMDLKAVGEQMKARKEELMAKMGGSALQ